MYGSQSTISTQLFLEIAYAVIIELRQGIRLPMGDLLVCLIKSVFQDLSESQRMFATKFEHISMHPSLK